MGLAGTQPTNNSSHAAVIDSLRGIVDTLPEPAFSPALINYVIFPVTTILRQADPTVLPDRFLEAAFRLLAAVVWHWKKMPGGMDPGSWEQLWRFVVGVTATSEKGKGKAREGEEVRLEATRLDRKSVV